MLFRYVFLALIVGGCSEYKLEGNPDDVFMFGPVIEVEPSVVDFGEVPVGEWGEGSFTIRNVGNAALDVSGLEIIGDSAFSIETDLTEVLREFMPDEAVEVVVGYNPILDTQASFALVGSDDALTPEVQVDLIAQPTLTELEITPDPYDFGSVFLEEIAMGTVTVTNVGNRSIEILDVYTDDYGFDGWSNMDLPAFLDPGNYMNVSVQFSPTETGTYEGLLQVENDTDNGIAQSSLIGNGNNRPIAICYADPDIALPLWENVSWIGHESYDPDGGTIVQYNWSLLTVPTGSSINGLPAGGADRHGFVADLAGIYTAELVVVNDLGVPSKPCVAELEVIPGENLWVEMFWTHPGDDMDLHLIMMGGGGFNSSSDCYYSNCVGAGGWLGGGTGLNWGDPGFAGDDPNLDLDDISATGPENINIPVPADGDYKVLVHDYPGSTYNPANDVTVKIYVGGSLVYEETKSISGEDTQTLFAIVSFPSEVVTPF